MIDSNEWFIEQKIEEVSASQLLLNQHNYGFGSLHSGLHSKFEVSCEFVYKITFNCKPVNLFKLKSKCLCVCFKDELGEVAEIRNPDSLALSIRREQREAKENEK